MKSHQEFHRITSISYHNHASRTKPHCISHIIISYQGPSNQSKSIFHSCQTQHVTISFNHLKHMHIILHTFKTINQLIMGAYKPLNTLLSFSLKLKSFHSGERNPSLKLTALTWARFQIEGTLSSCSS